MKHVATIREILRYPVKSMQGEALTRATLDFQGIPDDRRYAFVQAASRSDFPWLTARDLAELLLYKPNIEETSGEIEVTVTTPAGRKWPVESEELRREIEQRSGRSLFLLRQSRGSFDAAPISLISLQTVRQIAQESETEANARRFRPNLLIDLQGGAAFEESSWVGRILRVGDSARIAITELDRRCMIITLDPDTGTASPEVLRCVAQHHNKRAGVYGTVLTPGDVRVGDAVRLTGGE